MQRGVKVVGNGINVEKKWLYLKTQPLVMNTEMKIFKLFLV